MKPYSLIYLQWHSDGCQDECAEEVTWCQDKINNTDVEYIRKDMFDMIVKKYDQTRELLTQAIESGNEAKDLAERVLSSYVEFTDEMKKFFGVA